MAQDFRHLNKRQSARRSKVRLPLNRSMAGNGAVREHWLWRSFTPEQDGMPNPGPPNKPRTGHWEADTVTGKNRACIWTLVDRKTGYILIGMLSARTIHQTKDRQRKTSERHQEMIRSITSDSSCELHGYEQVEQTHGVKSYFAPHHHSWERGVSKTTNIQLRQPRPKGKHLNELPQAQCDRIGKETNTCPRKHYGFKTPQALYNQISFYGTSLLTLRHI